MFLMALLASSATLASSYSPEQVRSVIKRAGGPERLIAEVSKNTSSLAGQMIDDQTQLTGSVALKRTVVYYLRLVNYEKKDLGNLAAFRRKVAGMLAPSVCTAPIASILINEYRAEYKYITYSKSREYLFEYAFNQTTCSASYRW